jgi:plasmid stability protein
MGILTVRNLDESVKRGLRLRAAQHGWSMEQEVRVILQNAVSSAPEEVPALGFAERVNRRFKGLGADDLPLPPRQAPRAAPDWA